MSLGLDSTRKALKSLASPERCAPAIHVAGSNGKGTACAIISSALILSGSRVGTFTSPHVARLEERFRIDGIPIAEDLLDTALERVRSVDDGLTFFEATWLAACILFEEAEVDYMVVEVGLGGRLDATRTCRAMVSLVCSISLEHTEILGDDIQTIALEKAAIEPDCGPLVMKHDPRIVDAVESRHRPVWCHVDESDYRDEAAILAQSTLEVCGLIGAASMVKEAQDIVRWPGRMQEVEVDGRTFLLDSAHNPSGVERLCSLLLDRLKGVEWALLFGTSPQTDMASFLAPVKALLEECPPVDIICTEPQGGRYPAVPAEDLPFGRAIPDPIEALETIDGKNIISFGSLYLQGNLISALGLDSDEELSLLPRQRCNT